MSKVEFPEPLFFLNIIGIDPRKTGKFAMARKSLFIFVVVTTITSSVMEMTLNYKNLDTIIRASEIVIPQYQLIWKVTSMLKYKSEMIELVEGSENFWKPGDFGPKHQSKLGTLHKHLKKYFFFYKCFMGVCGVQFVISPILLRDFELGMMICYGEGPDLHPVIKVAYYILHTLYMFFTYCVVCGFDGFFFYMTGHILTEFEMITKAFGDHKIAPRWERRERFELAVEHHTFILKYIDIARRTYSVLFLNQFISGFFAVCFGLFLMSKDGLPPAKDDFTKFSTYICVFVLQMWTYCFAGNLIIEGSTQISNEVFHGCWNENWDFNNKIWRVMAIKRAQKPAKLTIGGYSDLDLESFTFVMKNSFSFFTFISAMYEEK